MELSIKELEILELLRYKSLNFELDNSFMSKEVIYNKTQLDLPSVEYHINELLKSELIEVSRLDSKETPCYRLTPKGKDRLSTAHHKNRERRIWSIFVPIGVAVVSAIITTLVMTGK